MRPSNYFLDTDGVLLTYDEQECWWTDGKGFCWAARRSDGWPIEADGNAVAGGWSERIDEAEVIRLTERREALLERRSYALDRLANCSGEAEAMWLQMIEECEEELAKLDKPE
jgi:hypothetical protein